MLTKPLTWSFNVKLLSNIHLIDINYGKNIVWSFILTIMDLVYHLITRVVTERFLACDFILILTRFRHFNQNECGICAWQMKMYPLQAWKLLLESWLEINFIKLYNYPNFIYSNIHGIPYGVCVFLGFAIWLAKDELFQSSRCCESSFIITGRLLPFFCVRSAQAQFATCQKFVLVLFSIVCPFV